MRAYRLQTSAVVLSFWLAIVPASGRAGDDAPSGSTAFRKLCALCHELDPGRNKTGPSLHNVVGRKAGSLKGFDYSQAMAAADIVWTPDTLDAYLTDPAAYLPGTRMVFAGLDNARTRADIIAYLIEHSPGYRPGDTDTP